MSGPVQPSGDITRSYSGQVGGRDAANLGDILERVLDKGLVIAGDIRINLLDIELLTIKLRLLIVSVETAKELGIDWWERDPWLNSDQERLAAENRRLRERLEAIEEGDGHRRKAVEAAAEPAQAPERASRERRRD